MESRRRRRKRRSSPWTEARARAALLALALIGSALAFGAQHPLVLLALALVVGTLTALSVHKVARISGISRVVVGLLVFTLIQRLSLPMGWLRALSPHVAETWERCLMPFGNPSVGAASLTLDPTGTTLEILKWMIYLGIALSVSVVRRERGGVWLAELLFASGTSIAIVTLAHGLVGAERVYGFYTPTFRPEHFRLGPLINSNNLAGYLNLCLGVSAGLSASSRTRLPPLLLTSGSTIMAVTVLASGSRGGLAGLGLGAVALVAWHTFRKGTGIPGRGKRLASVLVLLTALGLSLGLGKEALIRDWFSKDWVRKLAPWRWSLNLIRDNPWFGVGRGAFETALPAYREPLHYDWASVFVHAENVVVQWTTEWGVIIGGGALLLIGVGFLRTVYQRREDGLVFGIAVGIGCLLLENLVDLATEIPAVALALFVAWGAIEQRDDVAVEPSEKWRPGKIAVVLGITGLVLAFGAKTGLRPVHRERIELGTEYRALDARRTESLRDFRTSLKAAMLRHPGEHYFAVLGGLLALRAGDQNPIPWFGRALELNPVSGPAHFGLAVALQRRGALGQGLLHLGLAGQFDATLRSASIRRAATWGAQVDDIARAFPKQDGTPDSLAEVCPKLGTQPRIVDCWRKVLERNPSDPGVKDELIEELAGALGRGDAPCSPATAAACRSQIDGLLAGGVGAHGVSFRSLLARATLASDTTERNGFLYRALDACTAFISPEQCSERVLLVADQTGALEVVLRAVDQHTSAACAGPSDCAMAHAKAGAILAKHGAWGLSLQHQLEAARLAPNASNWLSVAETATKAHVLSTARLALDRAQRTGALSDAEQARFKQVSGALSVPAALGSSGQGQLAREPVGD